MGSPTGARLVVFLGIGLVFTALFLLVGRTLARLAFLRGSRSSPERDSIPTMRENPPEVEPAGGADVDPELERLRKLLASVEELRALLAPLTVADRERVLELARQLKEHPTGS